MKDYLDIDLNTIKTIPITNKRGIYFLYDNDELVYIGQSISINTRIYGDHVKTKRFNSYKYIEVDRETCLDKIEQLYIIEYQPRYNKNTLGMGVYPQDATKEKRKGHTGKRTRKKEEELV